MIVAGEEELRPLELNTVAHWLTAGTWRLIGKHRKPKALIADACGTTHNLFELR